MKHRLPTLDGKDGKPGGRHADRAHAHDWSIRPAERAELAQKIVAVAHVNQLAASGKLAGELCAAFAHASGPIGQPPAVGALVTIDNPAFADETRAVFNGMMEAGVRSAKLLRKPGQDARAVLDAALADLAGVDWIIAWGNVLPQLFKPFYTIVVTGHRRDLNSAEPLVTQAQLEVTAPGPELATLLARRLLGEVRAPSE